MAKNPYQIDDNYNDYCYQHADDVSSPTMDYDYANVYGYYINCHAFYYCCVFIVVAMLMKIISIAILIYHHLRLKTISIFYALSIVITCAIYATEC